MNEEELRALAWAALKKQDIPSVQAVIDALYPILETWWLRAIEDALRRGDLMLGRETISSASLGAIDALSGNTPDGRQRFEIEALLSRTYMRLIEDAVSSYPAEVNEEIQDELDLLLLAAAGHWDLPGGPPSAFSAALISGANFDIGALVAGRIGSRRGDVQVAVQELVRNTMRGLATEEATKKLRELLGLTSMRQWLGFSLDIWAYRWFNLGILEDARKRGYRFFRVINNPPNGPDARTTPFCRHIHGSIIDIDHALAQAQSYVDAAADRKYDAMKAAWPLLETPAANDTSEGAAERAERTLKRLGLPPYHPKCRTVVEPVRRG